MKVVKLFFVLFLIFLVLFLFFSKSCDRMYVSLVKEANEANKVKIGNNYFIDYSINNYLVTLDENTIIIDDQIIAWNYDSTFIVAKQKPFAFLMDSLRLVYPNTVFFELKKIYDGIKIYNHNYWIIDKRIEKKYDKTDSVYIRNGLYGPLSYEKYLEKRKELGVPDSLKLKKTEEWLK